MEKTLKYTVFQEGGIFVAQCLDIDVASDGATDEEAVANLREALSLYFERAAEDVERQTRLLLAQDAPPAEDE